MSLTYVEASILAAWALEKIDPKHTRADKIIDDITSGKIDAITSTLAVMEVIDSIRRRVSEKTKWMGDPSSVDMAPVKQEIERLINDFLDGLTALAIQKRMIWIDPESPVKKHFQDAQDVLLATFGSFHSDFKDFQNCYAYRGVGQYDVQHALIAQSLSANELLTFDKGFRDLASNPKFSGFSFIVK
jgi:predicted nucleic acid-binding protein